MPWLTDYTGNASQPTITNSSKTAQPNGASVAGSWSVGTALGDASSNTSKQTLVGTAPGGGPGTITNTLHGLTYISTTAGLDGVSLNLNASSTLAAIRINEPGNMYPQVNGSESSNTTTFVSGHEYTITDTGSSITFADNGVVWYTESYTNVGGLTRPFCCAYATAKIGSFTLAGSVSTTGTRLPPPPIVLGGL